MLRALFLAPPGAGKGTQGPGLAEAYGVPYVATGDMLRRHVADATPLGVEAKSHMERGELVPDALIIKMVLDRISKPKRMPGFVLDGFPRTLAQAQAAYDWGSGTGRTFHAVISLVVPNEELLRRVVERQKASGRADDDLATFEHRLEVYAHETEPLIDYYRQRGILVEVEGTGDPDTVAAAIRESLAGIDLDADRPNERR